MFIKQSNILLLLMIPVLALYGAEEPFISPAVSEASVPSMIQVDKVQDGIIIREVIYNIDGLILEYVLRQKAGIDLERRFGSEAELSAYLVERRQILLNERVLEAVSVNYELHSVDRGQDAVVTFNVKNSWNLIALPYFSYDPNTGLLLSLRGRDYNFLGSMQALTLNLDYKLTETFRSGYGAYTAFSYPFLLGPIYTNLSLSEEFNIFTDDSPPLSITNIGFAATYTGFSFPINASLSQSLSANPDGIPNDSDPYFLTSNFNINAAAALIENLANNGALVYNPSISVRLSWRPDNAVREDRKGLITTFSHNLSWGRADWIGNMKQGLVATASNTYYYYSRSNSLTADADLSIYGFATAQEYISVKARLQAFKCLIGFPRGGLGANMRGIMNTRISGDTGVSLNLDVPIKLFDFPAHLLIKRDWFDFELQASPFVDAAYYRPTAKADHGLDNFWCSGGLEFLIYPKRMRSFIVRGSAGIDLRHLASSKNFNEATFDGRSPYELTAGIGLMY